MTADPAAEATPYWSFVKFDLADERFAAEAGEWFDSHIADLVVRPGMGHAWRTEEDRSAPNVGPAVHRFWTAYEMDDPERFRLPAPQPPAAGAPGPPPPPSDEFNARRDLTDWARSFYFRIAGTEAEGFTEGSGRTWVRELFDLTETEAGTERHLVGALANLVAQPGVHRGWVLRFLETELSGGVQPDGQYLYVFEVDDPHVLAGQPAEITGHGYRQRSRYYASLVFEIEGHP